MEKQPRYVSELVSTSVGELGASSHHFRLFIYDTHRKKSLRGVKQRDQDRPSVKYELAEVVVGEIGEDYPDFSRRAEQRLADLNSQGV